MLYKALLTISLVCLLLSSSEATWPCPEAEDIAPCMCHSDSNYRLHFFCDAASSGVDVELASKAEMPFNDYDLFAIRGTPEEPVNVTSLLPETFGPLEFMDVEISNTLLSRVEDGSLINSEQSLVNLNLQNNQIDYFIFEALHLYTVLEELDLSNNMFSDALMPKFSSDSITMLDISYNNWDSLTLDQFSGLPSLTDLNMEGIGLENLPRGTFDSLTNLVTLNLNSNNLGTLSEGDITSSYTLKNLYLNSNGITAIEPNSITGMDPNGDLEMANNEIVFLNNASYFNIFEDLIKTQAIVLSNNPLRCGCEVDWLFEDTFWANKIEIGTNCSDGTPIHTLDPMMFDNC